MKLVLTLLLFMANVSWAHMESQCEVTKGFFKNNKVLVKELKFQTVTDIFTLNNARTLTMELDGDYLKFTRTKMATSKQTKMSFVNRHRSQILRTANVIIDRTPHDAIYTSQFYGIIQITEKNILKTYTYNFYCHF